MKRTPSPSSSVTTSPQDAVRPADAGRGVITPFQRFLAVQDQRRRLATVSKAFALDTMKHTLYEDPVTHKFAFVRLPEKFADGDPIPILPTDHWFGTREEAMAALPELLNQVE